MTNDGGLFHARAAATGKARSPIPDGASTSRWAGTMTAVDELERSLRLIYPRGQNRPVQTSKWSCGRVVGRWDMTEWSECSTSCDRGQQTRTVECKQRISAVLSVPVTADRCIHEPRPPTVRACNVDRPCVRWRIGNWSQVRPAVLLSFIVIFVTRPSYRPHYASCPSVRPFVCLSVPYGLVTRKQKKNVEKSKLA